MADINIQKKNKPVWPWWIIGVVAIVGVLWWAVESTENSNLEGTVVNPIVPGVGVSSDADLFEEASSLRRSETAFTSFIRNNENREKIGDDPEVTGEALIKLSEALRDLVNEEDLRAALDRIERDGRQIQEDHELMDNADKLSATFATTADIMGRIQQSAYPQAENEVNEVRVASEQVNTDEDLFAQRAEVTSFFDEAAEAIQKMEASANSINE